MTTITEVDQAAKAGTLCKRYASAVDSRATATEPPWQSEEIARGAAWNFRIHAAHAEAIE